MGCIILAKTTEACYSEYIEVLDKFNIKIETTSNPFNIKLSDLFTMACRINKKRSFLFVSKVLGKHIPSDPKNILNIGYLLFSLYIKEIYNDDIAFNNALNLIEKNEYENLELLEDIEKYPIDESTLVITFAETATALGHTFFNNFKGNIEFIHTTRENLKSDFDRINFKEEHSHATDQILYPINLDYSDGYSKVLLIDDEFTTGRTCLNIIREIHKVIKVKKYVLISILDWRSKEDIDVLKELEKEIDCEIECISIIKGDFHIEHKEQAKEESLVINQDKLEDFNIISLDFKKYINSEEKYCKYTGRFGLSPKDQEELIELIKENGKQLKKYRKYSKTLVLGTGEFMYIPLLLAAEMGDGVFYHSTTRSPICDNKSQGYPIQSKYPYVNPYDLETINYIYNIEKGLYDEIYIMFETEVNMDYTKKMLNIFKDLDIKNINLVVCDGGAYE